MSTRSAIIIKRGEKDFAGIYCHFDGYTEGVGQMLLDHYNDVDKINDLIDLGDISILAPEVHPQGNTHSFAAPEQGVVLAYGRDRGDKHCATKLGNTARRVATQIGHNGYVYLFKDGKWEVNGVDLEKALDDIKKQKNEPLEDRYWE